MSTLYDTDFYAWPQEQAALWREGAIANLDLEHLLEELEDQAAIMDARREIATLMGSKGVLYTRREQYFLAEYPTSRRLAAAETRLPLQTFPALCPWTIEQVLNDDFFPEGDAPWTRSR